MTKYREIKGTLIQNVSADPPASFEGQVWYNTTTNQLRVRSVGLIAAWSTANTLNTSRYGGGGTGTKTSALAFGGWIGSSGTITESWNGTNWTEVNDLNLGRHGGIGGAGADNTSALAFGGFNSPPPTRVTVTETWNGTNWTEVNDLGTARSNLGGNGTQTSALAYGGDDGINSVSNTESWNGTNWTEVNDLNIIARSLGSTGADNTSALAFSGVGPPPSRVASTESWNGTNWTEVNDLNTGRHSLEGAGTQTSTLAFGGSPAATNGAFTESWNGTSWTEVNDLNTGRLDLDGAGANNTSALAFIGNPGGTATEEWGESPGTGNFNITSS